MTHFLRTLGPSVCVALLFGPACHERQGGAEAAGDSGVGGAPGSPPSAWWPRATVDPTSVAPRRPREAQPVDVAVGGATSCVVLDDGSVWCWGSDAFGEVGWNVPLECNGAYRTVPTRVHGVEHASQVAVTTGQGCARLDDGHVVCWGSPGRERWRHCGRERVTATEVRGVTEAADLELAESIACVTRRDGTVWCWQGVAGERSAATAVRDLDGVAEVRIGPFRGDSEPTRVCARFVDGAVRCGGLQPDVVARGRPWTAPEEQPGAPRADGVTKGRPWLALEEVPIGPAIGIAVGSARTCAVRPDHTVACHPARPDGSPDGGVSRAPKDDPLHKDAVALWLLEDRLWVHKDDGRVLYEQRSRGPAGERSLELLHEVRRLSLGRHVCMLRNRSRTETAIECWGANAAGQLGDGTRLTRSTPTSVRW